MEEILSECPIETRGNVEAVVNELKNILLLEEGWDGESAQRLSIGCCISVGCFFATLSNMCYRHHSIIVPVPEVNPCSNNSIDLSWRTDKSVLLINSRDIGNVSWYGESRANKEDTVKGLYINGGFRELMSWVSRNL